MPTDAKVKRFFADTSVSTTEECVLAADYDKLVEVCREMREWLVFATDETLGLHDSCDRENLKDFIAIIGEK